MKPNLTVIKQALTALVAPGDVVELRVFDARRPNGGRAGTVSGYFSDLEKMSQAAARWSGQAVGAYLTLNPTLPDLLARSANREKEWVRETTQDAEITRRRWLFVDLDPVRPRGISATDEEQAAAVARKDAVRDYLRDLGFPAPIEVASGNGAYLLYRLDLPNDDASRDLVRDCLRALSDRFTDDAVTVDQTTFNAARVCRLPGTLNAKGDQTAERPHRLARILHLPDQLDPVPVELLTALASQAAQAPIGVPVRGARPQVRQVMRRTLNVRDLRIVDQFNHHGLYGRPLNEDRGIHTALCPWEAEHSTEPDAMNSDTIIYDGRDGRSPGFKCQHAHCAHRTVQDVLTELGDGREFGATTNYHLTDTGNVDRLVDRHGADIRHCDAFGWLTWDGTRWRRGAESEVVERMTETVLSIYLDAAEMTDGDQRNGNSPNPVAAHARKSEHKKAIADALWLARHRPELRVEVNQLDADLWLLNCLNGTLDLRTQEFREHRREDLITKVCRVRYDPTAKAGWWFTFLNKSLPNPQVRGYLQRAVGYSLTGETCEKCMFILHGPSNSGKTTFLEALGQLFGDYGQSTSSDLLLARKEGSILNDLAKLQGARFVRTSETEEGKRLAVALVKAMTGRDRLNARFLYKEWFDFSAEFKLWFATNHKPIVRETSDAAWNRLKLIPFPVGVPERDQVKDLPNRLQLEGSGILNWALEGLREWQRLKGLAEPTEVKVAGAAYRREMDLLGEFLEECCITGDGGEATAMQLHSAYVSWCRRHQEVPLSLRRFGPALQDRGLSKIERRKIVYYQNIRVLIPEPILI